jgi:hypothetical protein
MTDGRRAIATWDAALDALAARLRAQEAFVRGDGAYPEGSWTPPAGALPATCRDRALVLLAQSREIERELDGRRRRKAVPAPASPYR